jgi:hypothetical protein
MIQVDALGKTYDAHTYENAPHSFFDRAQAARFVRTVRSECTVTC